MNWTRESVITDYCEIGSLVYHGFKDYSQPDDGFCCRCPGGAGSGGSEWSFQSSGRVAQYVRRAVEEALVRDGIMPAPLTPWPTFKRPSAAERTDHELR